MEFLRSIHKTFYAHDFCSSDDIGAIYYFVRDSFGKEIRIYSINDRTVKHILRGNSSMLNLVASANGQLLAYNENNKLHIFFAENGKIIVLDQNIFPAQFCFGDNYLIGVKYEGTKSSIIKIHIEGKEYSVLFEADGYVGDPKQNFIYGGIKVSHNLVYDERTDFLFILCNNYSLQSSTIYIYSNKIDELIDEIQLENGFVLNGKIILYEETLYFKRAINNTIGLYGYNIISKEIIDITKLIKDVKDFIVVNNEVLYEAIYSNSMSTYIYSYNLENGNIRSIVRNNGCNTPISIFSNNLIYVHSDYKTPPELYLCDNKGTNRLTYSSYLKFENSFNNINMTIIRSDTGVISKCYSMYGIDQNNTPIIVWLHGGPNIFSLNNYVPFELWLCSLGYKVYVPSYRGTLGCGLNWALGAIKENIGVTDLEDVSDVINTILNSTTDYKVKLGVAGVSYGAYLALRCAARAPRISAVFGFGAISDWRIQQSLTEKRNYDYWLLGNWYYNRDVKSISPLFEIDKISIPVFLTHGKNDTDVPFKQIEKYKELAEQKCKQNIMFRFYENEGHGLPAYNDENFKNWHCLISSFFNYYLKEWNCFDTPFFNQSYLGGNEFEDCFNPMDFE